MRSRGKPKRSYASALQREGVTTLTVSGTSAAERKPLRVSSARTRYWPRRAEREPATGARRAEIGALGPHRERRLRHEVRLRSAQAGEEGFLLGGEDAADSAPSLEVIRQVDEAQVDVGPAQQAQAVRLCNKRVGVVDETPAFDEQPAHAAHPR